MESPLVSIVTPSYNQGRFIGETIESVLTQDYPRIEYRVVDGGSDDNTLDVLRSFGDRVQWVSEPDRGQSHAINKGMNRATGEVVTWLCSDDVLHPGAVRRGVEALAVNPEAALVFGDADYIDATGRHVLTYEGWPFSLEQVLESARNPVSQAASFIRAGHWNTVGGLREELHALMDLDLWLRLALRAPLVYVPETWASARLHPLSKSVGGGVRNAEAILRIVSDFFARPDCPAALAPLERRATAAAHVTAGMECYQAYAMREARRNLQHAVRLDPRVLDRRVLGVYLRSLLGPSLVARLRRRRARMGDPMRRATVRTSTALEE